MELLGEDWPLLFAMIIGGGIVILFTAKMLVQWYHDIPEQKKLLNDILTELKKQNGETIEDTQEG